MASMTIRHLDDQLKRQLRMRAALNAHSMEEEARDILRSALSREDQRGTSLVTTIRSRLESVGEAELELPVREPVRKPVGVNRGLIRG
jgi:plasmid stability protein